MDNAENRLFRPWDRECVGRRLPPQDLNVRNERQEDTESVVTSTSASPALSYIDDLRSRGVFYFMHFGHHMTMSDPPLFPVDLSRMELNGPLTVTTTPAPSFPPFAPIAPFAPIPLPLYPSYLEFASPETRETIEAYWDRVNKDGYDANAPAEYLSDMEAAVTMVHQEDMAAKEMKKMRPKKFVCDTCNVAFSNKGQLRGHLRIHTGE
ncbi:uncharacterized protein LOC135168174 [Diachasmimorpha longicaudata]|uniref:uncharacterized protein LOC135168174 n=1 Tax=Diachasmimorpha longicaudata TaxID=58733 RepID=UPI0030B91940